MNTTLTIKTEKKLRDEAKRSAEELGLPLTTVVNALLRQFVRERELTISIEPRPTQTKLAFWEKISLEMDREKNAPRFKNAADLLKDLGLQK